MSLASRISLLGVFSVGILSCFVFTNTGANTVFDGARALADLEKLVGFGPRPSGSAAHRRTQEYALAELKATGFEVERDDFTAETPVGSIPMSNLIAVHRGQTEKFVVFAGHYDTKRFDDGTFVGANDGGSRPGGLSLEAGSKSSRPTRPLHPTRRLLSSLTILGSGHSMRVASWSGSAVPVPSSASRTELSPSMPSPARNGLSSPWTRGTRTVWYEIRATSKSRAILARVGYPVSRYFQERFRQESALALREAIGGGVERRVAADEGAESPKAPLGS